MTDYATWAELLTRGLADELVEATERSGLFLVELEVERRTWSQPLIGRDPRRDEVLEHFFERTARALPYPYAGLFRLRVTTSLDLVSDDEEEVMVIPAGQLNERRALELTQRMVRRLERQNDGLERANLGLVRQVPSLMDGTAALLHAAQPARAPRRSGPDWKQTLAQGLVTLMGSVKRPPPGKAESRAMRVRIGGVLRRLDGEEAHHALARHHLEVAMKSGGAELVDAVRAAIGALRESPADGASELASELEDFVGSAPPAPPDRRPPSRKRPPGGEKPPSVVQEVRAELHALAEEHDDAALRKAWELLYPAGDREQDLHRAADAFDLVFDLPEGPVRDAIGDGVVRVLRSWGARLLLERDVPFDPERHEAVWSDLTGPVIRPLKCGVTHAGRVVRKSLVVTARGPADAEGP